MCLTIIYFLYYILDCFQKFIVFMVLDTHLKSGHLFL